ncbi:Hypothetical protein CINCED_3A007700 [Cinara cedri]|uniref:Uncharacterized protein n=1 Tax=Cinara cedri TaxID=506608 RepID=A0A5E4NB07_9HEMI|nr:Hypothetical protein CINCED_3A007700 [Cinara cedri]
MSFNFNEHGRTFTDNNGNNSLIDFNNMDDGPELSPEMEAQCQALSDSITAKVDALDHSKFIDFGKVNFEDFFQKRSSKK